MLQRYPVYSLCTDVRPSQDHRILHMQTVQINLAIVMHPFLYVVTNNLALYQFLTLRYYGKIERNNYLHFAMF